MIAYTFHYRLRAIAKTHAHKLSAAAFVGGFVLDNLLLPRVDSLPSLLLIVGYISLAALTIAAMGVIGEHGQKNARLVSLALLLPFLLQFVFGGLLSMTFVYYFRSASLLGGWLFLLLIAALIVSNEFLIDRYHRLELQVVIFFTLLFCAMIFFVPIAFHRFGLDTFVVAGAVSVAVVTLFLAALSVIVPRMVRESRKIIGIGVVGVFLLIGVLYVTNAIPPIPLALRSAGVFHSVLRDATGNYLLEGEQRSLYASYFPIATVYHRSLNEPIFVTSAVFAPTAFETSIVHEWQLWDADAGSWGTRSRIEFPISGGREEGFRGYSAKETVVPGKWRVLVETPRGQLLGQVKFRVVDVDLAPALELTVF